MPPDELDLHFQELLESLSVANIDKLKKEQIEADAELLISNLKKNKQKNIEHRVIDQNDSTVKIPQIADAKRNKCFPGTNQNVLNQQE